MAEATGTNLAVSDGADSDNEQKSGFMDTIGSTDMVRAPYLVMGVTIRVPQQTCGTTLILAKG